MLSVGLDELEAGLFEELLVVFELEELVGLELLGCGLLELLLTDSDELEEPLSEELLEAELLSGLLSGVVDELFSAKLDEFNELSAGLFSLLLTCTELELLGASGVFSAFSLQPERLAAISAKASIIANTLFFIFLFLHKLKSAQPKLRTEKCKAPIAATQLALQTKGTRKESALLP